MRSILLFFMFLIIAPSALLLPHLGVMLWAWISIMNPHRLVWGFAYNIPFVLIIACLTLVAWFFSKERKLPPSRLLIWVAVALVVQTTVSSLFALHPEHSWPLWERFIKTFVLFFMVVILINSKIRIQAMLWILAISFGYFSTNGVLSTLSHGGHNVLVGPSGSMLADNNHLALSLVMILPILNYLRITSANKLVRIALVAVMMFSLVAILTSYSRGSLVALAAAGAIFLRYAKRGLIILAMLITLGFMVTQVMPQKWHDRVFTMQSVETVTADGSFSGRLEAWKVSWLLAQSRPLTGGGFSAIEYADTFIRFNPDAIQGRAAHSIYFQVLGDHGFLGLAMYLLMFIATWISLRRTIRLNSKDCWRRQLAEMLQVTLASFLVGGAALSVAYHDFILIVLAISLNLDIASANQSAKTAKHDYVVKSAA